MPLGVSPQSPGCPYATQRTSQCNEDCLQAQRSQSADDALVASHLQAKQEEQRPDKGSYHAAQPPEEKSAQQVTGQHTGQHNGDDGKHRVVL